MLAKLDTWWTIIRHYVPREIPSPNLDARFLSRIERRFFWYPSWPCPVNEAKITTDFWVWPGFWTWYPGKSWTLNSLSGVPIDFLSNDVLFVELRQVVWEITSHKHKKEVMFYYVDVINASSQPCLTVKWWALCNFWAHDLCTVVHSIMLVSRNNCKLGLSTLAFV